MKYANDTVCDEYRSIQCHPATRPAVDELKAAANNVSSNSICPCIDQKQNAVVCRSEIEVRSTSSNGETVGKLVGSLYQISHTNYSPYLVRQCSLSVSMTIQRVKVVCLSGETDSLPIKAFQCCAFLIQLTIYWYCDSSWSCRWGQGGSSTSLRWVITWYRLRYVTGSELWNWKADL